MPLRPRAMALAMLAALVLLGPHTTSFAARADYGNPWEANPNLVWNWRLPASTPVDPNSASFRDAVVRALRAPGDFGVQDSIWSNTRGFTAPIYIVDASTPRTPVDFGGGWHGSTNADGTRQVVRDSDVLYGDPNRARLLLDTLNGPDRAGVRIPAGAQSSPAADHEMVIYDTTNDTLYEFWNILVPGETVHDIEPLIGPATQTNSTSHYQTMTAGVMPNFTTTANGRYIETPGYGPGLWGSAATGLSYTGGRITPLDIERGEIRHAIDIALPFNVHSDSFVWPAWRKDYGVCSTCAAEGQRLRLPANVDLSAVTNPLARMVAVALRDYGAIVNDTSGKVSIRFDSSVGFTSMGEPDPWPTIFSRLGIDMTPADGYQKQANIRAAFAQIPFEQFEFLPGGWRGTGGTTPTPTPSAVPTTRPSTVTTPTTTTPTTRPSSSTVATTPTTSAATATTAATESTTTRSSTSTSTTINSSTTLTPATSATSTSTAAPAPVVDSGPIADAPSSGLVPPSAPLVAATPEPQVAALAVPSAGPVAESTAEPTRTSASAASSAAPQRPAAVAASASNEDALNVPPDSSVTPAVPRDLVQPSVAVNLTTGDGTTVTGVRLSARNLCRAFIEPQLSWTDPDIVADNTGLTLPNLPISPLAAGGQGSAVAARALANYCMANAPEQWSHWAAELGASRTSAQTFDSRLTDQIEWPAAVSTQAGLDDHGALALVATRPGAITLLMSRPVMPDGVVMATVGSSLLAATQASVDALRPAAAAALPLISPLSASRGNPWVPRTITIVIIVVALAIRRRLRGQEHKSRLL